MHLFYQQILFLSTYYVLPFTVLYVWTPSVNKIEEKSVLLWNLYFFYYISVHEISFIFNCEIYRQLK